ncbi:MULTISPECIES: hypothetical protein [unclassified Caballeronia]|uniref:hypothetical protein n=1 Tax=unclassified Caballeronia TaxID=2646786 RepID=UPI00285A5C75|nr:MULTISPECIES: hypothetical protein [unclassified Caballeronia]MDR5762244.1 hypothetical protein [Caballeronia sp. LZ035]MDR5783356.1 hypothetical protein [Caballeronia sp. LZ065]MDR5838533.1 hypothetical protein [Caballeronia sp. LZ034LL]
MIQTFEQVIGGQSMQFCASIADGGGPPRVIISRADSAESLVIVQAEGIIGTIKAEVEAPASLVADAVRKAQQEALIERALETGAVQTTSL